MNPAIDSLYLVLMGPTQVENTPEFPLTLSTHKSGLNVTGYCD